MGRSKDPQVEEIQKLMREGMDVKQIMAEHPELSDTLNKLVAQRLKVKSISSGSCAIHRPDYPRFE